MNNTIQIKSIEELFSNAMPSKDIRKKINCVQLDYEKLIFHFTSPSFINASLVLFVLSGTATVYINYKPYIVKKHSALFLSISHFFYFNKCSHDFVCSCLMVSKEFMNEMDSTDMIYRRIRYGVKLYSRPVLQLAQSNVLLLIKRISAINATLDNSEHLYQKEMILNQLFTFYLDLSNIIDRQKEFLDDSNMTRYEYIIQSFMELLVNNYQKQHKVDFYASRLNISARYLTMIVKRITGQSVCDFIFEMLYSQARTLLTDSKWSIQEITAILNFSDQSSFGKFFKRKSHVSPIEFRKKLN